MKVNKFYPEGTDSDQGMISVENQCPVCGSEELEFGGARVHLKDLAIPWKCIRCKSVGEERYDIVFSGHKLTIEHSLENRDV